MTQVAWNAIAQISPLILLTARKPRGLACSLCLTDA